MNILIYIYILCIIFKNILLTSTHLHFGHLLSTAMILSKYLSPEFVILSFPFPIIQHVKWKWKFHPQDLSPYVYSNPANKGHSQKHASDDFSFSA